MRWSKIIMPAFTVSAGLIFMMFHMRTIFTRNSSTGYIGYQLKKLYWQRQIITTYSWIYAVLLWLALVCYMWEITVSGTSLFRYTAIGISTAYIVADLEHLKKELTD